jgi:hypothetical protein
MRTASEFRIKLASAVLAAGVVITTALAASASTPGTTHPGRTSVAPGSVDSSLRLGDRQPDRSLHRVEPTPVPQPAPRPASDR